MAGFFVGAGHAAVVLIEVVFILDCTWPATAYVCKIKIYDFHYCIQPKVRLKLLAAPDGA